MSEPIDLSSYWATLQTRSPEGSNLLVVELEAPDLLSRSVLLCHAPHSNTFLQGF